MNGFKKYVKPILVLAVICIVVAGLLAATNGITAPIIERADAERAESIRKELLPEASSFSELDCGVGGVNSVFAADNGVGYIIESVGKGNNGDVHLTVGLNAEGEIVGLVIGNHSEDAGIGTKAFEQSYFDSFIGLSKTADGVDAVSGATYSSSAVKQAVELAFQAYEEVKSNG